MLNGFSAIVVKELKELVRDPKILLGMILVPLVIFPVLGSVLGYAVKSAQEQTAHATLLIVDNDGGNWSRAFISYLSNAVKVTVVSGLTPREVLERNLLAQHNSTSFIEIPSGFTANVTQHEAGNLNVRATVNVYSVYSGSSVFSGLGTSTVGNLVFGFNRAVAPDVVYTSASTVIKGEIFEGVDASTLSGLIMSQTIALPITIMILLTYAMQIAATSVAMEKEEKTLETLLSVPVDRFAILMGKLTSTIVVAGVAAVAVMVGYNYMLSSVTSGIQTGVSLNLEQLGLVPSTFGYVLLGVSLFVTLLSALALAVIVSAFAEDVRGAQALVGYIYPLIFIPAIVLLYLDVKTLPPIVQAVVYAIPYSHPIIAAKAVVLGDYAITVYGIIYVAAFTVAIMYIASRLFATEKILTAKLRFKRGRNAQKTEE